MTIIKKNVIQFDREFSRRLDQDLPFYYWTVNDRFRLEQEDFDKPPATRRSSRHVTELDDSDQDDQDDGAAADDRVGDEDNDGEAGDEVTDEKDVLAARQYLEQYRPQRLHRLRINQREDVSASEGPAFDSHSISSDRIPATCSMK